MKQIRDRNLISLSLSQFGMAFSYNYIMVFLPFMIYKMSPYSPAETLLWIGWIMGSGNFMVAAATIFWGTMTSRFRPKWLYLAGMLVQITMFLLMGLTSSLHVLLGLRILHGLLGGASTIGLIIISSTSPRERISADIGLFQTFITLGMLVGPPLGAMAATAFGYRGAFFSACALLVIFWVFCHACVVEVPLQPRGRSFFGKGMINLKNAMAWALSFTISAQLFFMPSVLPDILRDFGVEKGAALNWAGVLIMSYTATAALGTFFFSRLSTRTGRIRIIVFLVFTGTVFQALLSFSRGIGDFAVIRLVQTGIIAGVIPILLSIFVGESNGDTIGFLNSSRFAGAALGPILATSILARSNPTTLYMSLSGLTLLSLLSFISVFRESPEPIRTAD